MLRERTVKTGTEGSNPSRSASFLIMLNTKKPDKIRLFCFLEDASLLGGSNCTWYCVWKRDVRAFVVTKTRHLVAKVTCNGQTLLKRSKFSSNCQFWSILVRASGQQTDKPDFFDLFVCWPCGVRVQVGLEPVPVLVHTSYRYLHQLLIRLIHRIEDCPIPSRKHYGLMLRNKDNIQEGLF